MIGNRHSNLMEAFLPDYRDLFLYDAFHHIKAYLLYPPHCHCPNPCRCGALRASILLSLNNDLCRQAEDRGDDPDRLAAMRYILKIPEDCYFRRNSEQVYPLWLMEEKFQEKNNANCFRIVDCLVWKLLSLGATRNALTGQWRASVSEAVDLILGKNPLKSQIRKQEQDDYLCGEKGYSAQLNAYKSICHFIAAFRLVDPLGENTGFTLATPQHIDRFMSLSLGIRNTLLLLITPNVKEKSLFAGEALFSLPPWIEGDDHIPIDLL